MIRVVMTDNKSPETYKIGTKFAVDRGSGNLSVYNDSKEEIAVHAHGTWASVSVDNTQKYVDKLTPEMISGEWPAVTSEANVFDACGSSYIAGVTNFCITTVTEAIWCLNLSQNRDKLTLLVDMSLFNKLDDNNEIDRHHGLVLWKRFNIQVNPKEQDLSLANGLLETKIRHSNGRIVSLLTREF